MLHFIFTTKIFRSSNIFLQDDKRKHTSILIYLIERNHVTKRKIITFIKLLSIISYQFFFQSHHNIIVRYEKKLHGI